MKKSDVKMIAAAHAAIEPYKEQLVDLQGELQDTFDQRSEAWQEGDKGQHAQEIINALEQITGDLDSVLEGLSTLQSLAESVP